MEKQKKSKWDKLSLKARADLIKLYVNNGITSLDTIKKNYNSFAVGGDTENNQPVISEELNPSVVVDYSNLKQEAKDARDWVFDYYASEGYKNRAKQAELPARNPLKKHLGIFPKKKLRFEEDWSVDSSYNWLYPVIGLQESENPFTRNHADEVGFTTAHEFAHNNKLFNTPAKSYESTYRSPYYNHSYKKLPKKYIDALEVKQLVNPHDMEFSESYSDLIGLRYLLDKYNIFDSKDSNAVFDSKMYNNLIQDERFKNNRFLKLHEEKQVIDAINNVAHNTTDSNRLDYVNPENIAANGGKLNRYTTGGPVKTFDVNNPISPTQYWEDFIAENSVPFSIAPEAVIDENELVRRQAWAESAGNDRAGSHKGAKGRYQIMPDTLSEYQKATGDIGDIYDPIYNRRVRDWEFNRYKNSDQVNRGEPTDSVKMGRRLAIYNYGYGNVRKALNKADSLGADTDNSFEWLQYLPQETQDYVNFILRNKDTGAHRTNDAYKNRKK